MFKFKMVVCVRKT